MDIFWKYMLTATFVQEIRLVAGGGNFYPHISLTYIESPNKNRVKQKHTNNLSVSHKISLDFYSAFLWTFQEVEERYVITSGYHIFDSWNK